MKNQEDLKKKQIKMINEVGHSSNVSFEKALGHIAGNVYDIIHQEAKYFSSNFKTEYEKRKILLNEINDMDLSIEEKIKLARAKEMSYSFIEATGTRVYLTAYPTQKRIGYTSDRDRRFRREQT